MQPPISRPEPIRSAYGLPWDDRRERTLVMIASTCRIVLPRLPAHLRRWPAARAVERRVRINEELSRPSRSVDD
jgi:uncharacterized protein (DUF2236 family)